MSTQSDTWIARPGELILAGQAVPELATRVGGLPAFPQGATPPASEQLACGACGKPLALLLQAYAPLTAEQVEGGQPTRFLYVFCCAAEGCGKQPGCWRALRLVLPSSGGAGAAGSSSSAAKQEQQQQQGQPAAAAPPPADDWGAGGGDDWGAGASDDWGAGGGGWGCAPADSGAAVPGEGAAFDFGDLNAALEAAGGTAATAPRSKPRQQAAGGGGAAGSGGGSGSGSGSTGAPVYDAERRCLPAFYLFAEPEAQAARSGGGSSKDAHLAALMQRYEAEAAAASAAADSVPAAAAAAAVAAGACTPGGAGSGGGGDDAAPESWGGEGYEEDAVLAPGGKRLGAAYLKYSRQLARCPDQCARYSYGGCPLWPSSVPPPAAPPCGACGAPRRFELQLMAPLIHGLLESAEWLAAERAAAALQPPPDSWEWLTAAVFTCQRGCGSGTLVEEAVAAANEE